MNCRTDGQYARPRYKNDRRGSYPSQVCDSLLAIEPAQLRQRRHDAFIELNMHCEKTCQECSLNPIGVAISRAMKICQQYLPHLKRRATPWERTVIETWSMEQEITELYHPCRYVMKKGARRCQDNCPGVESCREFKPKNP